MKRNLFTGKDKASKAWAPNRKWSGIPRWWEPFLVGIVLGVAIALGLGWGL